MKFSKKHTIKIPKDVQIIYFRKNKYLLIIGPLNRRIVKVNFEIFLCNQKNIIYVTKYFSNKSLNNSKKRNVKSLRKTLGVLIKHNILESSILISKKLKLVGVGYRVFHLNNNLIQFRLGFSHPIFYKVQNKIEIKLLKSNLLYIFGSSISIVTQISANIKRYKKPEPYKGKGILYFNEKILLKQGKKI